MAKHLQVTLLRATGVDATTYRKSRTMVHATASFKNAVHTTSTVEDMGTEPEFHDDGSNVFHFEYEKDDEFVTFELFNRNNDSIGKSKLTFVDLEMLEPGGAPQEKTLKVMISREREFGELVLSAQLHRHQVMGEKGNLNVELVGGSSNKLTSIFTSKTTAMMAKLTYRHTTLTSGLRTGTGNTFKWYNDNKFSFLINNDIQPDDVLEVVVYNGDKVGGCKIYMKTMLVNPGTEHKRKGQELLKSTKKVGTIDMNTTFILPIKVPREKPRPRTPSPPRHEPEEPRRYSCPPTRFGYYPPPHDQIPRADHLNVSQVNIPYPPPQQVFPYSFHPAPPANEYAPTAPPADLAQHHQPEAHGAPPPSIHRPQAYVPEVQGYKRSFHF